MNIHEHQAKKILKQFGVLIPKGVVILSLKEITKKIKNLNSKNLVLKAQIHARGRGKAGGIKLVKNITELRKEAEKMYGKILVTHQTGISGKLGSSGKRKLALQICIVKPLIYLNFHTFLDEMQYFYWH